MLSQTVSQTIKLYKYSIFDGYSLCLALEEIVPSCWVLNGSIKMIEIVRILDFVENIRTIGIYVDWILFCLFLVHIYILKKRHCNIGLAHIPNILKLYQTISDQHNS